MGDTSASYAGGQARGFKGGTQGKTSAHIGWVLLWEKKAKKIIKKKGAKSVYKEQQSI